MRVSVASGPILLVVLALVLSACSGDEEDVTPLDFPDQAAALTLGEPASLHLANDSVATGLAVKVRSADGTETYGIFRGPHKLGEEITNGTWTFNADSLPTRVRVVGEGERLAGGT